MNEKLEIFTDGGCHGNPGPGGWAFRIVANGKTIVHELNGFDAETTNNRMELQAVIEALRYAGTVYPGNPDIVVTTDSTYVRNGITQWIRKWKKNGWMTAARQPVKNRELWQSLDEISEIVRPKWEWVRGHSGDEHNEACDSLVQAAIREN